MKKGMLALAFLAVFLFAGLASAVSSSCSLNTKLLSQDPYPAVPGDYVKLVFQVSGMANANCGNVKFELVPDYPISFDPGTSPFFSATGGVYIQNYGSDLVIPYKVRVDPGAVDGNSTLDFKYMLNGNSNYSFDSYFNLSIKDVRTTFDTFVKNYDFATNTMTLEILNTGKNDVDALTIEIPPQENFIVKGPNINVVGSLDAEDYSTADFEVAPHKGNMNITIFYNDPTGARRSVNQTVYFNPEQFQGRKTAASGSPWGWIIFGLIFAAIVAYIFYRRHKKNRKKKLLRE